MSETIELTDSLFGSEVGRTDQRVTVEPIGKTAYGSDGVRHCAEFTIGQADQYNFSDLDASAQDGLNYTTAYHTVGPNQIELEF
jgi:hypothetical protein